MYTQPSTLLLVLKVASLASCANAFCAVYRQQEALSERGSRGEVNFSQLNTSPRGWTATSLSGGEQLHAPFRLSAHLACEMAYLGACTFANSKTACQRQHISLSLSAARHLRLCHLRQQSGCIAILTSRICWQELSMCIVVSLHRRRADVETLARCTRQSDDVRSCRPFNAQWLDGTPSHYPAAPVSLRH